jgi:exonuclease III
MHVNIRSLLPKFVLFTALAHSANRDVLAVSEARLRKATKTPEMSMPNYNLFRQDRTAKEGGVAIYCRDSLTEFCHTIHVCAQTMKQLKIHLPETSLSP